MRDLLLLLNKPFLKSETTLLIEMSDCLSICPFVGPSLVQKGAFEFRKKNCNINLLENLPEILGKYI